MIKTIERFRWWLGLKLIQTKTMTATATMLTERATKVRCIHCGKKPFFIDEDLND